MMTSRSIEPRASCFATPSRRIAKASVWRTLWRSWWTDRLVRGRSPDDHARSRQGEGEGRGARRSDRSGGDRFHLVLLVTTASRLAVPVRRDVLRGLEQALSRAWI